MYASEHCGNLNEIIEINGLIRFSHRVNRTFYSLHRELLKSTLTVPLKRVASCKNALNN